MPCLEGEVRKMGMWKCMLSSTLAPGRPNILLEGLHQVHRSLQGARGTMMAKCTLDVLSVTFWLGGSQACSYGQREGPCGPQHCSLAFPLWIGHPRSSHTLVSVCSIIHFLEEIAFNPIPVLTLTESYQDDS